MSQNSPFPDSPFWRAFTGRASGLLHWPEVDALWAHLATAPEGWYFYDLTQAPPDTPLSPDVFCAALNTAEALVNTRRDRSHSGAIYLDNREAPTFIKVFDPANMGTSCGGDGQEIIFPRFIFSKIRPEARPATPSAKKGFLGRLILAK